MNNVTRWFSVIVLFFTSSYIFGQASNYFPQPGFSWRYSYSSTLVPDSLNPVMDIYNSVLDQDTIDEKICYPIFTDDGLPGPPFISNYVALEGVDALIHQWSFFLPSNTTFDFYPSSWLTFFKFQTGIVPPWIIIDWDTTLHLDSLSIPVKVRITGIRNTLHSSVTVPAGTFSAAQFNIVEEIGLQAGPLFVPFFTMVDSLWLVEHLWMVKHIRPAATFTVPENIADSLSITIPGSKYELLSYHEPNRVHEAENQIPLFHLAQNYPNPFNPRTMFSFELRVSSYVTLKVYDLLAREVATIIAEELPQGMCRKEWDASGVPSGTYYYQLSANHFRATKSLLIIK